MSEDGDGLASDAAVRSVPVGWLRDRPRFAIETVGAAWNLLKSDEIPT